MNKKVLIIIGLIILLILIAFIVVLFTRKTGQPPTTPLFVGAHTNIVKNDSSKFLIVGFSGEKYTVNNFLANSNVAELILFESSAIKLIYTKNGDAFYLLLKSKPYDQGRLAGETKLTELLGLSQKSTLCDINIHVLLASDYNLIPPEQVDYGVSVCSNAAILPK